MPAYESVKSFSISMPNRGEGHLDQDAEWCWLSLPGEPRRRVRFHDYHEIYSVPGLYERLFHTELRCQSPGTVCGLLSRALERADRDASELRVLDLGAGSGIVAEELERLGSRYLVGVDIIEEAAQAAQRDRPGLYDSYFVADMCGPEPDVDEALLKADLNCLVTVAALGFGDIPPAAFANSFNYIAPGGLIAFNLRDRFLEDTDASGYNRLIKRMLDESVARTVVKTRYRHRFSSAGEPLHYVAVVAEKVADIPNDWV